MQTETDKGMFEWFRREHGGGGEYVVHHGWYVFANGARLCVTAPLWYPEPADPEERHHYVRTFLLVRLRNARKHYETWRNAMESDAARCARTGDPLPFDEGHVAALKAEKAQLDRYQAEYDAHTAAERERAADITDWAAESRHRNVSDATRTLRDLQRL